MNNRTELEALPRTLGLIEPRVILADLPYNSILRSTVSLRLLAKLSSLKLARRSSHIFQPRMNPS